MRVPLFFFVSGPLPTEKKEEERLEIIVYCQTSAVAAGLYSEQIIQLNNEDTDNFDILLPARRGIGAWLLRRR